MSGVIRWEDPPPLAEHKRAPQRPWALIAQQLRDRPGEWGVVHEGNRESQLAYRIEHGGSTWFRPAGAFEAVERLQPDGASAMYVRYVGEPS